MLTTTPQDLKPGALYRLAFNLDEPNLRGKLVTFHEYRVFTQGDVPRARVSLIAGDGSCGAEYLVRYGCLIGF